MPRHNKQHDARAASFRRIAKALRVRSRNLKLSNPAGSDAIKAVSEELDFEAKTLRSMR
jgi:hypothetical protein